MRHRGAVAADRKTGDGAGVLLPIAPALVPGPWCGLAMVFLRDDAARAGIEAACEAEGIGLAGWRKVPVDRDALGDSALATMPRIEQLVLVRPFGLGPDEAEARAYRARRRAERVRGAYVASLSFRTVTYKALCAADQLDVFYADLRDQTLEVPFAIFHQRFSTNTSPSWERAQPFRLLCHNGEINTLRGNIAWMRARESRLGDGLPAPVLDESGLGLGDARQRRRAPHARRPRRPSRDVDAPAAGVAERSRARSGSARVPPLPRRPDRALGRACRRRLHRRSRCRRRSRPQRAATASLRDHRRRPRGVRVGGGRDPVAARRARAPRQARSGRDARGRRGRARRRAGRRRQAHAGRPPPVPALARRRATRARRG